MTASDICYARAVLEPGFDTFECRNPGADQVRRIVRSKEQLSASKKPRVVLVPAYSLAGPESLGYSRYRFERGRGKEKSARQVSRACLIGQRECLWRGPRALRISARVLSNCCA